METAKYSYTSVMDYMNMSIRNFMMFREALINVLEKEREARNDGE